MQIKPFHRWLLWSSTVATGLTGGVLLWMDRMMEPVDAWAVINHPLQPWVLKAHILVAPFLVLAIGMISTDHVWKLLRAPVKRARRTGLWVLSVLPVMILTGYLIQAVTHTSWLEVLAWTHIVTGVLYLAGLGAHQWIQGRQKLVQIEERRSRMAKGRARGGRAGSSPGEVPATGASGASGATTPGATTPDATTPGAPDEAETEPVGVGVSAERGVARSGLRESTSG